MILKDTAFDVLLVLQFTNGFEVYFMGLFSGSEDMVVSCKTSSLIVELIKSVVAETDDKSSFFDGDETY